MSENKTLTQVVAAEWSFFELFLSYMPNPDPLLEQTKESIEVYNRMLLDEQIGACLDVRKKAVLACPWRIQVKNGQEKVAELVENVLRSFPIRRLLEQLLAALEFGYSVVEVVWENRGGRWIPEETVLLKPERFGFTPDGRLRMLFPHTKELEEKYKFIVHRHGVAPENPYGASVLRRCYWPWTFKRAGWRFWLTAAEKFGVPTVLALFKENNEEQARRKADVIAELLSTIKTDAGIALANVDEVKTLEVRGDGLRSFEILIEMCNRAIAKAITGQVLATDEAKHGTRAQASVHEDIFYEVVDADCRELEETINKTLIPWIVELNLGADAEPPRFVIDTATETPWEVIKEAIDRGIPVSKEALYATYGIPKPKDEADAFVSPKMGGLGFSETFSDAERRRWAFRFV